MFGSRKEGPSAVEKDYLIRQLKQLLEALVNKILREGQGAEQSQEDLRNVCSELLDVEYDALSRLNVSSMAMLLRSGDRIEAFALLMDFEAQQIRAKGDVVAAEMPESRAQALRATHTKAVGA